MKIAVFDTETTGLPIEKKGQPRDWSEVYLCELACVLIDDGKLGTNFQTYFTLPEETRISEGAARVNGLTREFLNAKGVEKRVGLQAFTSWCRMHEVTKLVGHNAFYFDSILLDIEYQREGFSAPAVIDSVVDTKLIWNAWEHGIVRDEYEFIQAFYGRVYGGRYQAASRLEHLMHTFGINETQTHDALGDCLNCWHVFQKMIDNGIVERVLRDRTFDGLRNR